MRRHPALIPLSHQHHDALVVARKARRAADGGSEARLEAARAFLVFLEGRGTVHFREEEEHLFPLLVVDGREPPDELTRALLDHVRMHAHAARLRTALDAGAVEPDALREPGALLEAHVRLEERQLFPLIEELAGDRIEQALAGGPITAPADGAGGPVDLARALLGAGPQWGMQSDELNATLLAWPAGRGVAEHVNGERDVLVVVLDGSAVVEVDGVPHELVDDHLLLVPRGSRRSLLAGSEGVRYLSVHLRREPMQLKPRAGAAG